MNNQRFKKISSLILLGLVILLVFSPFTQVQATENLPQPAHEFYVYDEANMITGEVAQYIIQANEDLFQQTGAQIVVAIINSLEGETIEEYGNQLYREWGIGSAQEDNGVLLLVALEESRVWIEVGYGLEGALPDGKAGGILDQYIVPNFQQDQYSQGIFQGFEAILNVVEEEYQVEIAPQATPQYEQPQTSQGEEKGLGLIQKILIIGAILVFLFVDFTFFGGFLTFALLRSASRGGFRGGGGGGGNRGGGGSSGGGGAGRGW